MSTIRFFAIIALLIVANICRAQIVNEATARDTGIDFLNSKKNYDSESSEESSRRSPNKNSYELVYAAMKNDKACFYIYNNTSGGFVIVSADERTEKPILGYSTKGAFDYSSLGENAKWLLDSYKEQIATLDSLPQRKPNRKKRQHTEKENTSVAPLLGETAWDQDHPYNLMCPIIDGEHCLTGCVATAMAQIMYYHKWPERGNGIIQYESTGPIEADLSGSEYQWDLMLPTYDDNSGLENQMAVALLMRDCGYSVETTYGIWASGAMGSAHAFWKYFNYDAGMTAHPAEAYDENEWNEIIRYEIDNQRPVLFSGSYHEYVCDGYDGDYFHFNFGWSGNGNGYFLCSANGNAIDQNIICGIEKNKDGNQKISFDALQSFIYTGEPSIAFKSSISTTCEERIHCLTSFENNHTKEIILLEGSVDHTFSHSVSRYFYFDFDGIELPDGDYSVYPVVKFNDIPNSEIYRCHFRPDMQSHVDLVVKDGTKYFSNELDNKLPQGIVKVNGLYYRLNEKDCSASLTIPQDMKGSYNGDIVIPDSIVATDKNYKVTSIAEGALMDCNWMDVYIGTNVERIEKNAFRNTYISNLEFAQGSKLQAIGDYAFLSHLHVGCIILPEGLESIGKQSFALFNTTSLTMPSSLKEIGPDAFSSCESLRDVYVRWREPLHAHVSFFNGCDYPQMKLHVPVGTKEKYAITSPWSEFGEIVEDESLKVDEDYGTNKIQSTYNIYNSNGIPVKKNANETDIQELPAGLYIFNNKKVIVK
ncbi:MAG: C10 family peptidase [Bacteroidales bacterium]|nr:C10 family peptidase [Bacteroidales bacterium]